MRTSIAEATVNKTIIFVPYWIEKALVRNKRSLRDIMNYSVLRNFISKNDIAGLLSFQQSPVIDVLNTETRKGSSDVFGASNVSLLSRWELDASEHQREELDSTVIPMSHSLEKETLTRLKTNLVDVDESKIFKVVDIEKDSIVVVIYQGFLEGIKNPTIKYNLIKQLLSLSYVYCEVNKVSGTQLFRTYMDLLQSSTIEARAAITVE